jgi:hypothetical protein
MRRNQQKEILEVRIGGTETKNWCMGVWRNHEEIPRKYQGDRIRDTKKE